jgi:Bacterial regulatory protein, Fis family
MVGPCSPISALRSRFQFTQPSHEEMGSTFGKAASAFEERSGSRGVVVDDIERRMNEEALRESGGNKQKAAPSLGPEPPVVDKEIEAV